MTSRSKAREIREQIRTDIRESAVRAAEEAEAVAVPRGCLVLATPHTATIVRLTDIAEVATVPADRRTLGLCGLVTLHDGTRYLVPDASDVLRAMREVRA